MENLNEFGFTEENINISAIYGPLYGAFPVAAVFMKKESTLPTF